VERRVFESFLFVPGTSPGADAEGLARELTEESSEGSGLLKQPPVIDAVPIDFMSGEVVERKGAPAQKFRGQLIYPYER
jgi:hypothetical protein